MARTEKQEEIEGTLSMTPSPRSTLVNAGYIVRWGLVAVGVVAVLLGALSAAAFLKPAVFSSILEEGGPVERLSVFAWILAALAVWYRAKLDKQSTAIMLTFLAFGAREADLHKAFSSDSFLKIRYYTEGSFGAEKLLFGVAALVLIGMLLIAAFCIFRHVFLRGGWRTAFGQVVVVGGALLCLTKVADRLPSILRVKFGVHIHPDLAAALLSFEEVGELIVPTLFIIAFAWLNTARATDHTFRFLELRGTSNPTASRS